MYDNSQEILDFLETLSKKELSSYDEYEKAKYTVRQIYSRPESRHSYSRITAFILRDIDQSKQEGFLQQLTENLRMIIAYMQSSIDLGIREEIEKDKQCLDKLSKLWDHINLEFVRVEYSKKPILEIGQYARKIEKELENLKGLSEKIRLKMKNQQSQYITILGIFASIVLAFVSGLTFSTSVFANIHQGSIYRLIFVMVFVACFVTNILYSLFRFIENLNIENPESIFKDKAIISFNALMIVILMCDGVFYLHNH